MNIPLPRQFSLPLPLARHSSPPFLSYCHQTEHLNLCPSLVQLLSILSLTPLLYCPATSKEGNAVADKAVGRCLNNVAWSWTAGRLFAGTDEAEQFRRAVGGYSMQQGLQNLGLEIEEDFFWKCMNRHFFGVSQCHLVKAGCHLVKVWVSKKWQKDISRVEYEVFALNILHLKVISRIYRE